MNNILVPVDFSDTSLNALSYAINLFRGTETEITVLHTYQVSSSAFHMKSMDRILEENAQQDMDTLMNRVRKEEPDTVLKSKILKSGAVSAITSLGNKGTYDFIVMGTKGATKAKEIVFGSNTVHIIKKVKSCPILVVPDEYDFVKPEQIAFPTDFNRFYGEEILPLTRLADLYNSTIRIVHINKEDELTELQEHNLNQLKIALKDYPHSFHWMPDYGKKTEAINDFIEELQINILAMINYKHSFIEGIIKEPVIKKLGFKPNTPFMVIPCTN